MIRCEIKESQRESINPMLPAEKHSGSGAALNIIYKVVRHFYLMGKKNHEHVELVNLMVMRLSLQEAEALQSAISAFKRG